MKIKIFFIFFPINIVLPFPSPRNNSARLVKLGRLSRLTTPLERARERREKERGREGERESERERERERERESCEGVRKARDRRLIGSVSDAAYTGINLYILRAKLVSWQRTEKSFFKSQKRAKSTGPAHNSSLSSFVGWDF